MGIFKKVGGWLTKRKQMKLDAKQKRLETKERAQSDRERISADGASERAAITGQNEPLDSPSKSRIGGKLGGFLDKAKGFLGGVLGGGEQETLGVGSAPTEDKPKDNKMLLIGGLALAGVLGFFMLKKKK